jgi:D-alanyl-D-alanine carboxypeptidase/D-alanyl-D-alanine-endopeptidase (penicillin-binding protein 4)
MRKAYFASLLAVMLSAPLGAVAQTPTPAPSPAPSPSPMSSADVWRLQSFVDAALTAPTLKGAHVGVLAIDGDTGAVLYARNADDDFVPASTFKLIAGSMALAQLGPAFTFTTDVDAAGSIEGGTLQGDLYLRGGGDAQLSSADLNAAAAAVAAAGVRHVSGALIADASRYGAPHFPQGWAIDDIPYEFAAVPSALSVDLNVAHVRVLPGEAIGARAALQVRPESDAFALENATVTGASGSADTTDVERPWNRPLTIRVSGSYPLGAALSDDLEPAVPDPAAYALDLFRRALARNGVTLGDGARYGNAPVGATVLWSHRSKPLAQLLGDFWPPSNNLIGEQLLEELGAAQGSIGGDTRARGIAAEAAWLQSIGVDPAALTIADGSGLSAYDRVTPRALVTILQADWRGAQRDTVLAALPLAGVRGTLASTFTGAPLEGNVYAKTGTTNHARLLAGYARTQRGSTVIFALMVNNWMDASPTARQALDDARAAVLTAIVTK